MFQRLPRSHGPATALGFLFSILFAPLSSAGCTPSSRPPSAVSPAVPSTVSSGSTPTEGAVIYLARWLGRGALEPGRPSASGLRAPGHALERVPWPDPKTSLVISSQDLTATYHPPTLNVRRGAEEVSTSIGPPSATPHLPRPAGLYVTDDGSVVVVEIGSAYGQGYNHYDEHRVLTQR